MAEEATLQVAQRAVVLSGQVRQPALDARFTGHADKALLLGGGVLELLAGLVAQQRYRHAGAPPQRQRQHALLLPVEEGKAVQIQVFPIQIVGLRQAVVELLHTGTGVGAAVAQLGVVGGEDQRHVPQLIAHGALHVLHMVVQRLRRDLIGVEFVGQRGQLVQECRALGRAAKHL